MQLKPVPKMSTDEQLNALLFVIEANVRPRIFINMLASQPEGNLVIEKLAEFQGAPEALLQKFNESEQFRRRAQALDRNQVIAWLAETCDNAHKEITRGDRGA